jgi:nicotinic acid mononucleotide adenylyltransferase
MINPTLVGQRIAEAIINEPGPCFYPGKFKPPHKGHYQAATELAQRAYIKKVYILISRKTIDGITPEDSLMIWNMYLNAEPNPKLSVSIATDGSPIVSIINYLKANPTVSPVYIAVGNDEIDDIEYGKALQEQFGDRVKTIMVEEKAGKISAPHVRNILASGDFEAFKEAIPDAAYNKGVAPKIFKMIAPKVKGNGPEQA